MQISDIGQQQCLVPDHTRMTSTWWSVTRFTNLYDLLTLNSAEEKTCASGVDFCGSTWEGRCMGEFLLPPAACYSVVRVHVVARTLHWSYIGYMCMYSWRMCPRPSPTLDFDLRQLT